MNRTIIYSITEEDAGIRIDQFLKRKGYSAPNLAAIKRTPEGVLLNNEFVYMRTKLTAGDTLTVHIQETGVSPKIPPVPLPLSIVYEDEDLIVLNKPAGMPVHPSLNNYDNTLANGLAWYYGEQGKPFVFRCCNRLDRDTSGLTVVAKHHLSAGILSTMTLNREVHREYLAIASGHVTPASGTISAPIARKGTSLIERMVDPVNGETAITHYRVVSYGNGYTLVALKLETGRTHQIRVHMQYLGFPLIGDYLYNPDFTYISRQALHAHRLSFPHPITGAKIEFEAPLPEDMLHAAESCGICVKDLRAF